MIVRPDDANSGPTAIGMRHFAQRCNVLRGLTGGIG